MSHKSRNVAVIGLGTFGVSVAKELSRMGDKVLAIDSQETLVRQLTDEVAQTLQADATDPKALAECGIESYDTVVISIGENIEASILAAMNAMDLGCAKVWVKAQTETQKKILEAIGVHNVVLPEQFYGTSIAQMIHNPMVRDFLSFGDGNYLIEMTVNGSVANKILKNTKRLDAHNLTFVGVYQKENLIRPEEIVEFVEKEATILLFGKRSDLRKFADAI